MDDSEDNQVEIKRIGGFQVKVELSGVDDIPDEGANTVYFFGREVLVYKDEGRPKAVPQRMHAPWRPYAARGTLIYVYGEWRSVEE